MKMRLYWERNNETEIYAKDYPTHQEYGIRICDGKTFTKDCRYIPNGYFKLYKNNDPDDVIATAPTEEGVDGLKQIAEDDLEVFYEPTKGKRRIIIHCNGCLDVEADYTFGEDYTEFVKNKINLVQKIIKDANIGVKYDDYNDFSDYITYVFSKDEDGEPLFTSDYIDLNSPSEIQNAMTNEQAGIPDLE